MEMRSISLFCFGLLVYSTCLWLRSLKLDWKSNSFATEKIQSVKQTWIHKFFFVCFPSKSNQLDIEKRREEEEVLELKMIPVNLARKIFSHTTTGMEIVGEGMNMNDETDECSPHTMLNKFAMAEGGREEQKVRDKKNKRAENWIQRALFSWQVPKQSFDTFLPLASSPSSLWRLH